MQIKSATLLTLFSLLVVKAEDYNYVDIHFPENTELQFKSQQPIKGPNSRPFGFYPAPSDNNLDFQVSEFKYTVYNNDKEHTVKFKRDCVIRAFQGFGGGKTGEREGWDLSTDPMKRPSVQGKEHSDQVAVSC